MKKFTLFFAISMLALAATPAYAQQGQLSTEEMKQANNPLASVTAINLHDYYVPTLTDGGELKANTTWLRVAQPVGRFLFRFSMPISTAPSPVDGHSVSGLGDANLFAIMLMGKQNSPNQFGIGPMVVAPTASPGRELGSGKWQLGAAAMVFLAKNPLFQLGGLITWQASVGGQSDRPSTSLMGVQPFAMWQLGKGTYLRSTATSSIDLESGHYNVPLGLGIGQVVKTGKTVFNIFLEPQYSVVHYGAMQPQMQLFLGLNMQFR